jgi:flagellar operon protein
MDKSIKSSNAALVNGLDRIQNLIPTKPAEIKKPEGEGKASFQEALGEALKSTEAKATVLDPKLSEGKTEATKLKFSNHAIERMQSRGITYSPDDLNRLGEAVKKAAAKGSKDTLVLMDSSALIVSVKNNTVVTVMDKNALKENVFTNIDSTIVM